MSENKALYKQILKSTTIFGGVQVFNILISIVRSKTIALLIGPAGMGIAGLLNAAVNLISGFTSLGLETSAVKYISQTNTEEDKSSLFKIIAVLKKTVWVTGITGALVTIVLSPWLSIFTFGDTNHTIAFVWISITLLFKQLTSGHLAVLQGLQKLQWLAKANFLGSLFGLIISMPFYYYLRIDAILPSIIISSFTGLFFSWYFSRKVAFESVKIPNKQLINEGKGMLKLGIMLSLSGLISTFVAYLIQIYISRKSGIVEVGFYNAGFTLLNSYVGLIFTSMGTDFFPRLAAVSEDNDKVRVTVSHQAQIAILIITPIIVAFLAFAPLIVQILFSSKFLAVIPMISFGITGMLFRAVSWSMGYILLAKGDSKMFIRTAFGFNSLFLLLHVSGYYFYGLTGLGVAFTIHYFLHFAILKAITQKRYGFYFDSQFYRLFITCIFLCGTTFLLTFIENPYLKYSAIAVMVAVSCFFSLKQLNSKINFIEILDKFRRKEK